MNKTTGNVNVLGAADAVPPGYELVDRATAEKAFSARRKRKRARKLRAVQRRRMLRG